MIGQLSSVKVAAVGRTGWLVPGAPALFPLAVGPGGICAV